MSIPVLFILGGFLGVLAYFARKNVTWDTKNKTQGSVGMAIVVFIIFAIIFFAFDIYLNWSTIPSYMYAVGGSLQIIALIFYVGFAMLCISMLVSTAKVGTMVA
jgi:preprotein translocase subunit SecE